MKLRYLFFLLVLLSIGCSNAPDTQAAHTAEASSVDQSDKAKIARGEALYQQHCAACHQASGQGLAGVFPPLAAADYLLADPERAIDVVIGGLSGEITVNGETYNVMMAAMAYLSDQDVADVLTYTLNAWGNDGGSISPAQVAAKRGSGP